MTFSQLQGTTSAAVAAPRVIVPSDVRTFQYDTRRASLPPRDYQVELVDAAWQAVMHAQPGERHGLSLATGGGKTRILIDVLFSQVLSMGARVLWLAPDWELVAQAIDDACARYPEARGLITYIGGSGTDVPLFGAPRSPRALLTFTTLQTFSARRDTAFANESFDLIVLDEVHYGEHGKLQQQVYGRYKNTAIFLGATATSRFDSNYKRIGRYYDLAALVERGVLARPELVSVETGIDWSPGVDSANGEFAARSLDELARNEVRNEMIVSAYVENAPRLGPTMVFACNIAHAERLTAMFSDVGLSAAATHCRMPQETAKRAVSRFRAGELDVIVNVRSLTTGVDIPHTQGIVLARPTTSDILLTQMIGRGSRKTPTKDSFVVLDIVDNVSGPNGVYIKRPNGFIGTPPREAHRRPLHEYVPSALEVVLSGDQAADGLAIQPDQTFAVEIWGQTRGTDATSAALLANQIEAVFPPTTGEGSSSWSACCVNGDSVVITSPVYRGAHGLAELRRVVDDVGHTLDAHGYEVAGHKPIHVFLGWCPELSWLREAVKCFGFFEPALASLAPPPAPTRRGPRPARRAFADVVPLDTADSWFDYVGRAGGTYHSFDMLPLFEKGYAVDVPLHTDSLDGSWLVTWVSLAMHILRAAEERSLNGDPRKRVQSAPICRGPRGNVDELCTFIGASGRLSTAVRERREQVMRSKWVAHARFGRLARRVEESWWMAG